MTRVVKVLFLVLFVVSIGWAQTNPSGSISGVVKDETGAVVPGAAVIITSQDTGREVRRVTSGPEGNFTANLLPVGMYTIAVEKTGFQRIEAPNIQVRVTETTNVPMTLQVGQMTTQVTVTAAGTPVQLGGPTMGQTVSNVGDLPLVTRNFLQILGLSSGTSTDLADTAALGRGNVSMEVNGQRATQNNFVLEGVNANDFNLPQFTNVPVPSPSAVAEFKTQTSLYDATAGRNSGGNIAVALKSGTKNFHGDVFEFFRNDKLNANDFFLNQQGQARPVLKQNIFGGSLGGPIPKTGLFFFLNYQGTRQRSGLANGTQLNSRILALPTDRSAENLARIYGVPAGSINPVSLALLNIQGTHFGAGAGGGFLIPSVLPTGGGAITGETRGLLAISRPGAYTDDNFVTNIDKTWTNDRISGRWFFSNNEASRPFVSDSGYSLPQARLSPGTNRFLSVNWNHVFGPTAVNDARFGLNRFTFANIPEELVTLQQIGATRPNMAQFPGAFAFSIASPGFSFGTGVNDDRGGAFNTFEWTDTVSKTMGRHSLRFGGVVDRYQLNRYNRFAFRGSVSFRAAGGMTAFQNFLLGNVQTTQGGAGFFNFYFRNTDYALFLQDDWKLTPRLTLNLGVRWEPFGISNEKFNRLTNLTGINDSLAPAFVFPEDLTLRGLGTKGIENCTYASCRDWNNIAPRFGFAYDPTGNGNWAIRGGYGIYYSRFSNQGLLQSTGGGVFSQALSESGVPLTNPFANQRPQSDFPLNPTPIPQLTGFDASGAPMWTGKQPGFSFFGDRHLRTPYVQQWNLTIQRKLGQDWLTEVGYVGNKGTALLFQMPMNLARPATLASPISQPLAGGGTATITESTLDNIDARVPTKWLGFPVGRLLPITNDGASSYHSLQASVVRRFGVNYFQAAYTYSKSIDNTSGSQADLGDELNGNLLWNGLNQRLGRGISDFDRTQRLVVSYSYEFPFFKNATGIKRALLGGWGSNAVITFQSGNPFTVYDSGGGTMYGVDICCLATANMAPGATYSSARKDGDIHKRLDEYFNTSAFTPTTCLSSQFQPVAANSPDCAGTGIGNAGRNILRGPFQQNWDFSLFKRFYVTERQNIEFRAEAFNLWNHPVFASPGCGVGACTLPAVDIQAGKDAGAISSTANRPRVLQFVLKYNF